MFKGKKSKFIFFIVIILIGLISYEGFSLMSKVNIVKLDKNNLGIVEKNTTDEKEISEVPSEPNIKNYAFFGVDSLDGQAGRSDSIIIGSVNFDDHTIKLSSVPRDSYVEIDGHGFDKINHAYAFGGPQLAIKTLNQTFELNIDTFVSVNFSTVPQIVDAIGGIDITLHEDELDCFNQNVKSDSSLKIYTPGTYTLNGEQVLSYSRIRYTDGGDFERTERHRTVITALFDKAKSSPVSEYYSLFKRLLPLFKTNLSLDDAWSLVYSILTGNSWTIETRQFPSTENSKGIMKNGVYYLEFDRDTTIKELHDFIYSTSPQ